MRPFGFAIVLLLLPVLAYAGYAVLGMRAAAQTNESVQNAGVRQPVQIVRDDRDVPHIRAASDHDLFFAQGYVEATDRLFQIDLLRRFVYGRLAEIVGPAALPADENARIADIRGIVARQWTALEPRDRALLQAFSDGVNAAMQRQPLPLEFRVLLYRPERWTPQDSLAVGMATVLDLIDPWDDVIRRDAVARAARAAPQLDLYSVTDPVYDAPIDPPRTQRVAPLAQRQETKRAAFAAAAPIADQGSAGSNEWAIGAQHAKTGRALLANDPHLRLGIPGVWYLVDLQSNDLHVAGASLAGTPGVILGHNDDIAWGATNGTVATESVYAEPIAGARTRREVFHVRFSADARVSYYRTAHGFAARVAGRRAYAVDWNADIHPASPLPAFEALNRARSVRDALAALRAYPGPPQNFVLADRSGAVAYQLAGLIPNDPAWGLRVHGSRDPKYPYVAFARLPSVAPSRAGILYTANNRMYGAGYPLRLTPNFGAPYRAWRIRELLHSKERLGVADLATFQLDTLSPPERDLAAAAVSALRRKHLLNDPALRPYGDLLAAWNGRFDPASRGAPIAWELRRVAAANLARYNAGAAASAYQSSASNADVVLLMRVVRERPQGWWNRSDYDDLLVGALRQAIATDGVRLLQTWAEFGRVRVRHSLSGLGLSFLDGATFPGNGDSYGVHVQTDGHSQSFRAVWEVGNWDAGGIVIPSGESGQIGSGHYTDLGRAWIEGRLVPLPFGDAAVRAAARATLTLTP